MEAFETPFISITDAIASHAKWRSGKTALVCDDQRRTWAEYNDAVTRVANGLAAKGLHRGEKVSVLMTNSIEMLEIMMGTVKTGGVIVPLSVMLTAESLATMINDSDSRFVFADARCTRPIDSVRRDLINILPDGLFVVGDETEGWINYQSWRDGVGDEPAGVRLTPDDDFNLIYSSGTTGTPKGIAHTHYARQQSAYILAIEFRFDLNSIAIVTTPLFANGTWIMMLPSLTIGSTLVIMSQFDPQKFLDLVERERCTHTFMVPTQYIVTMDVPEFDRFDLSSLKVLLSAGAPLRADTKAQMLRRFGGGVYELYGLTEGIATTLKPEEMEGKLSSVGTTVFSGDIRIIDDAGSEVPRGEAGEIVGYSSALMRGYYMKPEETADAIWKDEAGRTYLRTGDVGKLDEDGFLYILDRKKDMILSGGVNVFPKDIEEIAARHAEVADVAVIGIPHEQWGETPLAVVIKRPGSSLTSDELTRWANERLAKYQRISSVEFREELPRNALGKVLKKELREPYWLKRDSGKTRFSTRISKEDIMAKFLSVLVLLAFLGATAMAQWTVKLPQPTGPYQIGTTNFALVDETRPEAFTDDPKDHRELLVRCWYPAQPLPGAKPEPFWGKDTKEIGTLLAQFMRMPKTAFDDLALVQSHAYTDAPLSKSKAPYPVLVFSHGYIPGFLSQNTTQMEELASHGYVVFSIGHSYETVANIFPGGRVVPFSQARLIAFAQGAGKTRELNIKYAAATEPAEKDDLIKKIVAGWPLLDESLRIWAADVRFVLDDLERMNSGKRKSTFARKLNLRRIGIFGMSFGGATAGQVCAVDKRCRAGINLDGLQSGDLIVRPMERPFMFMQSEDAGGVNRLFFERAENDAYYVVVKETKHFNYSDFSLFSPDYKKVGILGPIEGERMEKIMNDYVLAFFDKYLKGKDAPLLKGPPANYPEVEFSSHGRQTTREK